MKITYTYKRKKEQIEAENAYLLLHKIHETSLPRSAICDLSDCIAEIIRKHGPDHNIDVKKIIKL